MFLLAIVMLSMAMPAKSQLFILGDVTYPSLGAMVHFQTMEVKELGFYNYGTYGFKSNGKDVQSLSLAAGLTYYWSINNDPQDCLRGYAGFNYNVWWNSDQELLFPGKTISFDIGVSKTIGRFTALIMWDPLNMSVKPGISYYF